MEEVVMVHEDVVKKANRSTTAYEDGNQNLVSIFYLRRSQGGPLLHQARRSFGTGGEREGVSWVRQGEAKVKQGVHGSGTLAVKC